MFSVDFYRKLSSYFGLLAIGVFLGLVVFTATVEIKDLDLWFHIRSGNYIFHHHTVPSTDVFSATAVGQSWVNHEWLFQVVVYGVKRMFGMDGLIYMQAGVVLLTFGLLLLLTYSFARQLLMVPLLYFCLLVYQTRFTIRPDIFSLLFVVVFILLLSKAMSRRWVVWALAGLQVVWANMHGYFFLGVVIVGLVLLAEWIKRSVKLPAAWNTENRLGDAEFARLKFAFIAVILATLINPLTWRGALYPLTVLSQVPAGETAIFFQSITELQRPITGADVFDLQMRWPYKLLILLSCLSFVFNRRMIDIRMLGLWLFFLIFSLSALRNMTYFACVAYLALMANAVRLKAADLVPVRFVSDHFLYLTGFMAKVILVVALLNLGGDMAERGYYDFDRYERKSEYLGIDLRAFPHKAVDFLKQAGIKGNFFNDFNSGAYLIGRAYPDIRVFIDGRTELRGAKFFETYKKIWEEGDEKLFNDAVARYQLTGAFLNTSSSPAPEKILKLIAARKDWFLVYLDYDALIFLKDVPANAEAIDKYAVDLAKWKPMELDLKRFGPAPIVPYQFVSRANSLLGMGFDDQAIAEADAAIAAYPAFAGAYKVKADVAYRKKDFAAAFQYYRLAVAFAGSDMKLRSRLASCYYELGDYDHAELQAERVIEGTPKVARPYFVLAKALAKKNQNENAYDILMQALKRDADETAEVVTLGDIFWDNQDWPRAGACYKIALKRKSRDAGAREKLADLLGARQVWKKRINTAETHQQGKQP